MVISWWKCPYDEIDNIIKKRKDDWVIFQEWDYISQNHEVKSFVLSSLINAIPRIRFFNYDEEFEWFKRYIDFNEEKVITHDFFNKLVLSEKERLSGMALGVISLFNNDEWIFIEDKWCENKESNKKEIYEYLKYLMKNIKLKKIIVKYMKLEECKYKRLKELTSILS